MQDLQSWLERGKKTKEKKRLRKVSKRRAGELAKYLVQRNRFIREHPTCEICNARPSQDVHHCHGRFGARLLDEDHWKAVCRQDHMFLHANPLWAKNSGLLY